MPTRRFASLVSGPVRRKSAFACMAALAIATPAVAAEYYFNDGIFAQNHLRAGTNLNDPSGYSIAVGYDADATGGHCAAFGIYTRAVGHSTLAAGWGTVANGQASTSLGYYSTATSFAELAIGRYNTIPTSPTPSTTSWESADRLLVLGMGTSTSARADALVIWKDGKLTGYGPTNIFTGQMRIGGTTAPDAGVELDVAGDADIEGTLKVGGATLPSIGSLLTTSAGNLAYHSRANDQVVLGTTAIADTNAAIIVGNGSGGNSFKVIKATGAVTGTGSATFSSLSTNATGTPGALTAGATSITTLGVSGIAGFTSSVSISGSTSVTSLAASGNITGSGTDNTLPNQTTAPSNGSILTRVAGDARYFNNNDPQIVIGSFEVADSNAALIIGNGTDTNNRSNSFVVKKNGSIVVSGDQSDLSMGTFN